MSDNRTQREGGRNGEDDKEEKEELEELCKRMPPTEDTTCGIGIFKAPWLQRMANKKTFVVLYGVTGCLLSSTYANFNGTITTIEKRFKIPSRTTGVISTGNDITGLFASVLISYYGGKGHRPRWIACGLYCAAVFCFMTALPHLLYGPGEDALLLTLEQGNGVDANNSTSPKTSNHLCLPNDGLNCDTEESSLAPQALLFIAQLISGVGCTAYYTLGLSYMDDNTKQSKSPLMISFSFFMRTLGPPVGYALASACLKLYIDPSLTPTIDNKDPRWLGAWWLGWIVQGVCIIIMASLLALLPKTLPRAAARRERFRLKSKEPNNSEPAKPSFTDMLGALKRIIKNKVYIYSHLGGIFYVFGYIPYWIYLPKYIEVQYRQSASASSFASGVVGLVWSAVGILASGLYIQRFKPSSRNMAAWNLFIGFVTLSGVIAYTFLGCDEVDKQFNMIQNESINVNSSCAVDCDCEFSKYSPVCAADGSSTYISACHAGCTLDVRAQNGTKIFTNCSCVDSLTYRSFLNDSNFASILNLAYPGIQHGKYPPGGVAQSGSCSVDCLYQFYCFLGILCLLKFFGAAGRVTNFLLSVRCVDKEDKSFSLGIGMAGFSLLSLVPAPIVFGYIIDTACLVWGRTCTNSGNCWLYNAESLRYRLNLTSLAFLTVGNIFDVFVWYYAKFIDVYGEAIVENDSEEKNSMATSKVSSNTTSREDVVPLQASMASDVSKINCLKLSDEKLDKM